MSDRVRSGSLREILADRAESFATPGTVKGVCVLLLSSVGEEVEILHRHGLDLEVCTALADANGREILSWARRSPRAHLLRREGLMGRAPELARLLDREGLGALALFPLKGEDSVLGYVVVGLPPVPRGVPLVEELEEPAWRKLEGDLDVLGLEVGQAVLREVLALRGVGRGRGARALLAVDAEDRVLFSHGSSRVIPSWGRGEVRGQTLKGLPGGKTLAAIELSHSPHLIWRNRTVGGKDAGRGLSLAAIPLSLAESLLPGARLILIRDPRAEDGAWGAPDTALLMELALRVTEFARRVEGEGSDAAARGSGHSGELAREALALADREDQEERIDLSGLFRDLLHRLEPELRDDRIQVLPFLAEDLPPVLGDHRSLETAFWSLLRRSWSSLLPRGGTITLRSWEEEGSVWSTISDDGPGIEDWAVLEMLALEPLLRARGGETLPEAGIHLARELIGKGGGAFHTESRPRLWTRYSVVFPAERVTRAARAPARESLPPAVTVRRNGNGHLDVLVVDDNEMVRMVLRKYLERQGHAVTEAVDGSIALDMVAEREFDRVMVDIDMPGTTGVEFFERLGSVAPFLRDRTVFMTGGFQEAETEDYIRGTGRPHIQKPFDLREIGEVLQA